MAVALGGVMGAINGVIVAWGRVPSIIVTLGTLAIYRGVLVEYSGAKTVTTDNLPAWLIDLPRLNLFVDRRPGGPRHGGARARRASSSSSSAPATCPSAAGSTPSARTRTRRS